MYIKKCSVFFHLPVGGLKNNKRYKVNVTEILLKKMNEKYSNKIPRIVLRIFDTFYSS